MESGGNLSLKERRYCSCLMKVREKGFNPYGICYKSVLRGKKSRKGTVPCSVNYTFKKFPSKQLREYAREKRVSLKYKRGKNKGKKIDRKTLLRRLDGYIKKKSLNKSI
jgi:hypothetical protein